MALSANTIWEVRSGGSSTNGGGYVSGGTDWTQQDAAQYSVTDAVTNGTTTITSATASFGTDVVGNVLYIQGGTGAISAGRYQIITRNSATSITVDRATGLTTGTGATLKIGGGLDTYTTLATAMINSNIAYFKGTFNLTGSAITLAGTGRQYIGYGTTRGDTGQAEFSASGMTASQNTFVIGNHVSVRNFKVTSSRAVAFASSNQAVCYNCTASAATTTGFFSIQTCVGCYALNCPTGFLTCPFIFGCVAESTTTGHGFTSGNAICVWVNNIAINCGSSGTVHGFNMPEKSHVVNCVSYGSRNHGFTMTNMGFCANCIAVNNGGYGFSTTGDKARPGVINSVAYNNTSGSSNGLLSSSESVTTLTGSPFISPGTGDFRLNTTAGAGELCRDLGYPGQFPNTSNNIGYNDIGAVHHMDAKPNIILRKRKVR